MANSEAKTLARRELAARLGVSAETLAERPTAARILGLPEATLRSRPEQGPAFYKAGKWTWYPRDQLALYVEWLNDRRAKISGLVFGPQVAPPEVTRPRVAEMHDRVDLWRLREEWTRSHQLLTIGAPKDSRWRTDAVQRLLNERSMLNSFALGIVTPEFRELAAHIIGRPVPEGEVWTGGFLMLVADALQVVTENEARWLSGDRTGMPKTAPSKYGHETSRHKTEA